MSEDSALYLLDESLKDESVEDKLLLVVSARADTFTPKGNDGKVDPTAAPIAWAKLDCINQANPFKGIYTLKTTASVIEPLRRVLPDEAKGLSVIQPGSITMILVVTARVATSTDKSNRDTHMVVSVQPGFKIITDVRSYFDALKNASAAWLRNFLSPGSKDEEKDKTVGLNPAALQRLQQRASAAQ